MNANALATLLLGTQVLAVSNYCHNRALFPTDAPIARARTAEVSGDTLKLKYEIVSGEPDSLSSARVLIDHRALFDVSMGSGSKQRELTLYRIPRGKHLIQVFLADELSEMTQSVTSIEVCVSIPSHTFITNWESAP